MLRLRCSCGESVGIVSTSSWDGATDVRGAARVTRITEMKQVRAVAEFARDHMGCADSGGSIEIEGHELPAAMSYKAARRVKKVR